MKNSVLSIITAACLLISTAVMAQAPQAFNYQAVARNASGQVLASQNVNVRITIRTGTATGTNVYQETHQASTNQFGLFTLAIGTGDFPTSTFSNISWGTNKHFLQVEMDPAAGGAYQDMGTSELLSVPYALVAGSVAGGGSSPWTTTGNNISNSNSGNVGIGTTSPAIKFHVKGDGANGSQFSPSLYVQNNTGFQNALSVRLKDNITDLAADYNGTANATNLTFSTRISGGGITEQMRVTDAGRVGIGTTSPTALLEIRKDSTATNSAVSMLKLSNRSNTAANIDLSFQRGSGNDWLFRADNTGFGIRTSSDDLVTSRSVVDINTSGDFSIGTTVNSARFYVVDSSTSSTRSVGYFRSFNTTTGRALELDGYLKVSGNKTAFKTTAPGSATSTIALSYSSMASTDIVIVTPVVGGIINTSAAVTWNSSLTRWEIVSTTATNFPSSIVFNVLVIKQ